MIVGLDDIVTKLCGRIESFQNLNQKIAYQRRTVDNPKLSIQRHEGPPQYSEGYLTLPASMPSDTSSFYLRSAINHIHSLDGNLSLHAAYLQGEKHDTLLTGPSKSGKSTITYDAVLDGYDIIADDHVILNENYAFGNRIIRHRQSGKRFPTKQIGRRKDDLKIVYLGDDSRNRMFQDALKYRVTPLQFEDEEINQDDFYNQSSQISKHGLDGLLRQGDNFTLDIDEAREAVKRWM